MKYKLETIPVWDAVEAAGSGCPFCTLMEDAERRVTDYYLGSSVMNPETRVKVNTTGFCPDHYGKLAEAGTPQALALITHTHLLETMRELDPLLEKLQQSSRPAGVKKTARNIAAVLAGRDSGCLICESMEVSLKRYLYTFVHLYTTDTAFQRAFAKSKGLCLHHLPMLLESAGETLSGSALVSFCTGISEPVRLNLEQTLADVHWMTQRFKSEHAGEDWRGCEDAHRRAAARETGRGRIPSGR